VSLVAMCRSKCNMLLGTLQQQQQVCHSMHV
jgi:hypothetical protein